jgi:hypothetical protein
MQLVEGFGIHTGSLQRSGRAGATVISCIIDQKRKLTRDGGHSSGLRWSV